MKLQANPTQLKVYHEGRRRRVLVGALEYNTKLDRYIFSYDEKYIRHKQSIPIGPEFPLTKPVHKSKPGKIFPSLSDRIPSRENPAYGDYCEAAGTSVAEANPIILLTTIGKRGPSTFIFEPVYDFNKEALISELKAFRKRLEISLWEFAAAFDIPYLTIQRIENGKSKDMLTMRLVQCYLAFPDIAKWQLKLSGQQVNREALVKLQNSV